ncbi:phytoene desaturase family protein [Lyngbya confervoides]|uniref:NAD(P)/FAD-dependent oxidoreductase n=1 Tax=Lyngbya confervoides BDU141951 TaxID=1574623 RepID=A0ABD4SZ51_9CYAN|nr:NAD(P)/FAD-dependent oxidoreductase [Lyngbya confervoides]MCM1981648.1 NAD(P)/FAD-dependent oxidoreductase [Lyngbya confervoides BDU141951]
MELFDDVILGAGLGGLSAAACLTQQGKRVAVLEQHYLPGGCCHTFQYGDYHFCADVHYIYQCGKGEVVDRFLSYIHRDVPFNSLNPDCIDRIITPEVDFRIPLGWDNLRHRLVQTFPDEATAIHQYCDEIQLLHQEMTDLDAEIRWYDYKWYDWLKLPKYWNLFRRRQQTLQDLYDQTGLSPKLQDLLAGQSGDYALPPQAVSLMTHTSLVWDYCAGAYYPKYHFKHFVNSIVDSITDGGGIVLLSTPVEHIEVEAGQVQWITAAGDQYQAQEAYISDLDPKLTVELMHDPFAISPHERHRLTDYEYSTSAFNIYLGLDRDFDPNRYGLGNWNIWYYPQGNLNQIYHQQMQGNLDHPWIFLSCPTLKSQEEGIAPAGHHILEIATVCPYEPFQVLRETDPAAYKAKKRSVYDQLMHSVQDLIPDLKPQIRMKLFGTPTTSARFLGQPKGNIYGANLIPDQVGLRRIGYRTAIPNLYLVNATAGYPSVPGVISNGMNVVELITHQAVPHSPAQDPIPLNTRI